jgi:hypothetical protein
MMKPQGNRQLGRPRHKWRENTKMGLKKVGWKGDWINMAQDRDKWYQVLNTEKTFGFHKMQGILIHSTSMNVLLYLLHTQVWNQTSYNIHIYSFNRAHIKLHSTIQTHPAFACHNTTWIVSVLTIYIKQYIVTGSN